MYTTHRTGGSVIPVAVRHVSSKFPVAAGEVGGKSSRLGKCPELVEGQELVLVGAAVACAREVEGDAGRGPVDAGDGGGPSRASELFA